MNDPYITMEEYIMFEEEKVRKREKVFNWKTAKCGKIWYDEDVHDLRSVETEFPAIVFNYNLTLDETLSCESTVSSLNDNEIDFRISFDESDDERLHVNMPLFPSPEPLISQLNPTLCPQHIDKFNLKDETSLSECIRPAGKLAVKAIWMTMLKEIAFFAIIRLSLRVVFFRSFGCHLDGFVQKVVFASFFSSNKNGESTLYLLPTKLLLDRYMSILVVVVVTRFLEQFHKYSTCSIDVFRKRPERRKVEWSDHCLSLFFKLPYQNGLILLLKEWINSPPEGMD
ncbi:hypothetical protein Tco_1152023 [Tanacetum coccineum]